MFVHPFHRLAVTLVVAISIAGGVWASPDPRLDSSPRSRTRVENGSRASGILDVPDVYGPGKVLQAGRVSMKVTNFGVLGNPFTNLSSDPSGQWPDSSGIEYLNAIALAVAAVDPTAAGTTARRRVSYFTEWRPPTLEPVDRIYSAYHGIVNGSRFVNDDGDLFFDPGTGQQRPRIDEDFLDGRDNDGDGRIDEDYGALGWQEFSCVMSDYSQEAQQADTTHVPLGLECRQLAWTYATPGLADFNVVEYTIINRSGHSLDSLYIGWRVDMDAGALSSPVYFMDDRDLPGFPSGEFTMRVGATPGDLIDPLRHQFPHDPVVPDMPQDSALCPRLQLRINGFALADDDGDGGGTPGVAAFLLVNHSIDPLGAQAPPRVGFRSFRSFPAGAPYAMGGNPINDAERYAFMSATENIDPTSGFISAAPGATPADYVQWCSIGPFRNVPDGGSLEATVAFAVQNGSYAASLQYPVDYQSYRNGTLSPAALLLAYPVLAVARDVQLRYEARHQSGEDFSLPDFHGRETGIRLPPGAPPVFIQEECDGRDARTVVVGDHFYSWFDFDCDYCTGVWNYQSGRGLFHHTWYDDAPSPVEVEIPEPISARLAAFPNPAGERTGLDLIVQRAANARVQIFDVSGRRIRTVAQQRLQPGTHRFDWDLCDEQGARVRSGLYFWHVSLAGREQTIRIAVLD